MKTPGLTIINSQESKRRSFSGKIAFLKLSFFKVYDRLYTIVILKEAIRLTEESQGFAEDLANFLGFFTAAFRHRSEWVYTTQSVW